MTLFNLRFDLSGASQCKKKKKKAADSHLLVTVDLGKITFAVLGICSCVKWLNASRKAVEPRGKVNYSCGCHYEVQGRQKTHTLVVIDFATRCLETDKKVLKSSFTVDKKSSEGCLYLTSVLISLKASML